MADESGRRWDDAVERAWVEFRQRVADRLAELEEHDVLVVEVAHDEDDDGATIVPYCHVWAVAGHLRVEAVSNTFLTPELQLSPESMSALRELGFEAPAEERSLNFWLDLEPRHADRAAVMVVKAMREVYGVIHPVYLEAAGLQPGSVDEEAPERGGVYLYSDENQRIFARFGRPPVPLVPLVLDHNLRNTRQIHEAFGPLAPTRMTSRGGDGPDVHFIPSEEALSDADDAVEILLEAGWHPGNIALLTTGSRHPVQVELTEHRGQVGYWRTYWDDEVFYGHVLGCKGLERPAVVLSVNESHVRDRSREKLYVGMSRATDHLIVVGNPEVVREIGGPAVADASGSEVRHERVADDLGSRPVPLRWPDPRAHADGETVEVSGIVGRVVLDATSAGEVWADFELVVEDRWPCLKCVAFPQRFATLDVALEPGLVVGLRGRISLSRPSGPELHVTEWT